MLPLWPPPCRLCQRRGQGPWCPRCDHVIPLYPLRCPTCANPRLDQGECRECRRRPAAFASVTALGAYRRDLRRAILALKFGGAWDLAFPIGERLAAMGLPTVDLFVPVPLHLTRLHERGYDQAALVTAVLARTLAHPWRQALRRVRSTVPQARLSLSRRQANLDGAFAATGVAGRVVGLVDDVFTTGATVQAATVALRAAGARRVHVIVAARAIPAPWERS